MKKTILLLATLAVVVSLLLVACAQQAHAPAPSPAPTPKPAPAPAPAPAPVPAPAPAPVPAPAPKPVPLPKQVRIGTNPIGSSFNVYAIAFGDLISKHTPMVGKNLSVSGATVWLPMMGTAEVDLGVINTFDAWQAYNGTLAYKDVSQGKGYDIRLLTSGSTLKNSWLARDDSGIVNVKDIKGKRIADNFGGAFTSIYLNSYLLANAGLTRADVTPITRASVYGTIVEDLTQKKLDASVASLGSGVSIELDATIGVHFLNIDNSPDAVARALKEFPGASVMKVPAGTAAGIKSDTHMMYYPVYLISRAGLSDDAAYTITKAMWENYQELASKHPDLKEWTSSAFVSPQFTIPYHPGAIKLYKEVGVWNSALDARQQEVTKK